MYNSAQDKNHRFVSADEDFGGSGDNSVVETFNLIVTNADADIESENIERLDQNNVSQVTFNFEKFEQNLVENLGISALSSFELKSPTVKFPTSIYARHQGFASNSEYVNYLWNFVDDTEQWDVEIFSNDMLNNELAAFCEEDYELEIDKSKLRIIANYRVLQRVGRGSFSEVYAAEHVETREKIAVKVLLPWCKIVDAEKSFWNELYANLVLPEHPNIIKLIHPFCRRKHGYTVLFFELFEGGDLFDMIVNDQLNIDEIEPIFKQLIDVVSALHANNICHMDIKPENILFDANRNLKLGDFGLSIYSDNTQAVGLRGSSCFVSPEVIQSENVLLEARRQLLELPSNRTKSQQQITIDLLPTEAVQRAKYDAYYADSWSCGVVLFLMLFRRMPWQHADLSDRNYRIFDCKLHLFRKPWTLLTPNVRRVLNMLLQPNPQDRHLPSDIKLLASYHTDILQDLSQIAQAHLLDPASV